MGASESTNVGQGSGARREQNALLGYCEGGYGGEVAGRYGGSAPRPKMELPAFPLPVDAIRATGQGESLSQVLYLAASNEGLVGRGKDLKMVSPQLAPLASTGMPRLDPFYRFRQDRGTVQAIARQAYDPDDPFASWRPNPFDSEQERQRRQQLQNTGQQAPQDGQVFVSGQAVSIELAGRVYAAKVFEKNSDSTYKVILDDASVMDVPADRLTLIRQQAFTEQMAGGVGHIAGGLSAAPEHLMSNPPPRHDAGWPQAASTLPDFGAQGRQGGAPGGPTTTSFRQGGGAADGPVTPSFSPPSRPSRPPSTDAQLQLQPGVGTVTSAEATPAARTTVGSRPASATGRPTVRPSTPASATPRPTSATARPTVRPATPATATARPAPASRGSSVASSGIARGSTASSTAGRVAPGVVPITVRTASAASADSRRTAPLPAGVSLPVVAEG